MNLTCTEPFPQINQIDVPSILIGTATLEPSGVKSGRGRIADLLITETSRLIDRALDVPTVQAFRERRDLELPIFANLIVALGNVVVSSLTDYQKVTEPASDFIRKIEKEFQERGIPGLSRNAIEEVVFLTATLRRVIKLISPFISTAGSSKPEDVELARRFNSAIIWTGFHFECLRVAARKRKRVPSSILQELVDGFRVVVMAYSYIRQALESSEYFAARYSKAIDASWDEEDEALSNF